LYHAIDIDFTVFTSKQIDPMSDQPVLFEREISITVDEHNDLEASIPLFSNECTRALNQILLFFIFYTQFVNVFILYICLFRPFISRGWISRYFADGATNQQRIA
jgi:hypothetical protein